MTGAKEFNVSVLGLGMMGAALASALLSARHRVTVWNRSPERAEPLVSEGATAASSAEAAIEAADVTIVCVSDHAATMKILSLAGNPSGEDKLLIVLTTMSSEESGEAAAWAADRGMGYLDGTIFGVPSKIADHTAMIVYSGPKVLFDANFDLLDALADSKHLSDEVGAAVAFDRVYYAYAYGGLFAFMQGAAMAHALGFSVEAFTEIVKARTEAVVAGYQAVGASIESRDHHLKECRADVWAEGFAGTLALCRETGVDDTLPATIMRLFERNSALGRGGDELSSIFETLIDRSGRQ